MNTLREKEETGYFNAGVAMWIIVSSVVWLAGGAIVVANAGKQYNNLQADAVRRGAAEWVASEYGSTKFRWKESQ